MFLSSRNPQGSTTSLSELLNLKEFLWVNPLVPNPIRCFRRKI